MISFRSHQGSLTRQSINLPPSVLVQQQVSGRLGMSGGRSPRHVQNPLSGEWRKTLSITHYALSPHPHIIICISFHLINWLQRFYRITMSLKRAFVPKSIWGVTWNDGTTIVNMSWIVYRGLWIHNQVDDTAENGAENLTFLYTYPIFRESISQNVITMLIHLIKYWWICVFLFVFLYIYGDKIVQNNWLLM